MSYRVDFEERRNTGATRDCEGRDGARETREGLIMVARGLGNTLAFLPEELEELDELDENEDCLNGAGWDI